MTMPSLYKQVVCFDLDDTLYKECNYLKSAFQEIAAYINRHCGVSEETVYSEMISAWNEGKSPFQEICARHGIGITVEQCLQIYRKHHPNISLDDKTSYTLKALHANGCTLGLITDGRSITQRNKIEALGLHAFFQEEHIIISEEFGSAKPSERNFSYFMELYSDARFAYIGDNLKKDFITPNKLGWKTICLLDNGDNIHKQDFHLPKEYLPKFQVRDIREVIEIIIKN